MYSTSACITCKFSVSSKLLFRGCVKYLASEWLYCKLNNDQLASSYHDWAEGGFTSRRKCTGGRTITGVLNDDMLLRDELWQGQGTLLVFVDEFGSRPKLFNIGTSSRLGVSSLNTLLSRHPLQVYRDCREKETNRQWWTTSFYKRSRIRGQRGERHPTPYVCFYDETKTKLATTLHLRFSPYRPCSRFHYNYIALKDKPESTKAVPGSYSWKH